MEAAPTASPPRAPSRPGVRLLLLLAVGAAVLFSGLQFVSTLLRQKKEDRAWERFLEGTQAEDSDLSKLQEGLEGSTAEPWTLVARASAALAKEDFEQARQILDQLEKIPNASLQSLTPLVFEGSGSKSLGGGVEERIKAYQSWRDANRRLFENHPPSSTPRIHLVTDEGDITIGLFLQDSPKASENFIKLCKEGFYVDTRLFEILQGASVRAGDPTTKSEDPAQWTNQGPGYTLEAEKGSISNFRGTISMHRNPGDTAYSGSQFVIFLKDQLGSEYLPFGQVVGGLEVLDAIGKLTSEFKNGKNVPSKLISIKEARVEE